MAGNQAQLKTLRDRGQEQVRFHHGERSSDAQAGSAAEGEVGEVGKLLGALRRSSGRDRIARAARRNADRGAVIHGLMTTFAPTGSR